MMKGFVFGGTDFSPYAHVTSVTRCVAPSRRLERTTVPGRNGDLVHFGGLESIEITVTAYLTARTVYGVKDQRRLIAAGLLRSDAEERLILPDEPDRYHMAIYEGGAELSRMAHRPKVELVFLCPDPIAYGQHRSAVVSGPATVDSGGTYRALPIIRVTPPAGPYWQITNTASGKFVRVEESFSGSQELVLDMGLARCTVAGYDHPVTASSDFEDFYLDGPTNLTVSGGEAQIEWEERWV